MRPHISKILVPKSVKEPLSVVAIAATECRYHCTATEYHVTHSEFNIFDIWSKVRTANTHFLARDLFSYIIILLLYFETLLKHN